MNRLRNLLAASLLCISAVAAAGEDYGASTVREHTLANGPKVVTSERGVVYSERRLRVDNDNGAALSELVQANAFVAHPYQIPVIGWPSDIESWKREDLQNYYKTFYAPNNAVMVVAGDVE